MKKEFSKAEEVRKEVDLNPNKRYNGFDALVDVAEYMRANFIRKKLQQQQQQQQQQLSHPSPMITGEKGNQCFSGKNAVDNACKKNDISIPPNKVRPKEEVLDISKLEKKMAMTSLRVISSMSESPKGMSREEALTKERLLKRLKEIEEENMMQVKRDCKKVVRFEDSDSDSEEARVRKTQKRSSKRSDPSLMITCEECNQYFSGQNTRKPLAIDNACKKVRPKEAVLDISKVEKKMAMTSQRVTKSEYPEGMTRGEIFRREKLLKRPMEFDDENAMLKRVKREELQVKKTPKKLSRKTPNSSKKEEKKKKNKGSFRIQKLEIPNPPRELPEKFMSRITAMGGKNLKCVITKRLSTSDCMTTEGRLSMPFSQIAEFLFEDEKVHLQGRNESNRKNEKKVKLIQPNHEEIDINLRQWDMPKPRQWDMPKPRCVSKMYVLVKPWNEVVRKNGLRKGEAIQVWSFRVGELDDLRFAIVRLSDDEEPANVGQLLYGEGPSNVGQLSHEEETSNIGQLRNGEETADVGQSMRIESDCTGTSVNGEEPDDVISTPELRRTSECWSTHGKRRTR